MDVTETPTQQFLNIEADIRNQYVPDEDTIAQLQIVGSRLPIRSRERLRFNELLPLSVAKLRIHQGVEEFLAGTSSADTRSYLVSGAEKTNAQFLNILPYLDGLYALEMRSLLANMLTTQVYMDDLVTCLSNLRSFQEGNDPTPDALTEINQKIISLAANLEITSHPTHYYLLSRHQTILETYIREIEEPTQS